MHLSINKVPDVVATVWPLEHSKAADLALNQVSPVDVATIVIPPLFESFTVDLPSVESSPDLNLAIVHLLDALTLDIVSKPQAIVLLTVSRLLILAFSVKLPVQESAIVN